MALSPDLVERRYRQQAAWTAPLRRHLFARAGLRHARRVLEVGCGPGAVLRELPATPAALHGLDLDRPALQRAQQARPSAHLAAGDALRLPYAAASFEICFFHYVLLWLSDPQQALREAARVTRPGGFLLAFAEPDYLARPAPNAAWRQLNQQQIESLRQQGADPGFGANLAATFRAAGLSPQEAGRLQNAAQAAHDPLEAEVLAADLAQLPASATGVRSAEAGPPPVVPTYFAWARLPDSYN